MASHSTATQWIRSTHMLSIFRGMKSLSAHRNLERDTAGDLNVSAWRDASIPLAKIRACNICGERASTQSTGLYEGSDAVKVVPIENVKRVSAQLEGEPLGDVNHLFEADVEVAITRLPEILNTRPLACIEVKGCRRFERVHIQHRLTRIEMGRRLQEWVSARQQRRRAELDKLWRYVAK